MAPADDSRNMTLAAIAAAFAFSAPSRLHKRPGPETACALRVYVFMCRKCLCTRFEHAIPTIHVLVALWHYARHCCSAVLSLYDRLCSLLSALLSLARARVTRVFCIPFCFSLSICFFSGGDLLLSAPNCAAFTASPRRWTRVPRVPHVRPRGRLAIPCRFSTIVIDRFSTIVIGTIVIIFINAWTTTRRQQGAHLRGPRPCDATRDNAIG